MYIYILQLHMTMRKMTEVITDGGYIRIHFFSTCKKKEFIIRFKKHNSVIHINSCVTCAHWYEFISNYVHDCTECIVYKEGYFCKCKKDCLKGSLFLINHWKLVKWTVFCVCVCVCIFNLYMPFLSNIYVKLDERIYFCLLKTLINDLLSFSVIKLRGYSF